MFSIGMGSSVALVLLLRGLWQAALVHPLAIESTSRREIRFLKPLVNLKYALTTLERMRRYAYELGYTVPRDEVAEIWRLFEAQDADVCSGMVDRYCRTGSGNFGVMEQLVERFPGAYARERAVRIGVIVLGCPSFMGVLMARRPSVEFEVPGWVSIGGDGRRAEAQRAA